MTLMNSTAIFQPARVSAAFLKMGIMGKQGSGKSKTAAKVTIGLIQHLKKLGIGYASKPVAMFDTEGGSDFLIPDFEAANIPFVVAKKSSFVDLIEALKWAEENASALIIDSITHPYRELIASYLRKKQRTFLQIDDWNYIKGENGWAQFTTLYLNSKLHIIMCGRAGDDLEQYVDEDGKRQLEKVGMKMKTEAETGFEPSLLVEMRLLEVNNRNRQGSREREFVHRAVVVKDRWDIINGVEFDNPDFTSFLKHIEKLNLGGDHIGIGATDSQSFLKTDKRDWQPVQRKIVHDEIKTLLELHAGGMGGEDKKKRLKLLLAHFDATWTEIEEVMSLPDLRAGYDSLHRELTGQPSKYAQRPAPSTDIDDEIPEHSAPAATPPQEPLPLKEQLLKQLGTLNTVSEILHFALEAGNVPGLNELDRAEVSKAVLTRQGEIAKLPKPGEEKPEGEQPDKKPSDRKRAVASTEDEPPAAVLAAG